MLEITISTVWIVDHRQPISTSAFGLSAHTISQKYNLDSCINVKKNNRSLDEVFVKKGKGIRNALCLRHPDFRAEHLEIATIKKVCWRGS